MKIVDVFPFEVLEKIKEGKSVHVVDKIKPDVFSANITSTRKVLEALEAGNNRYGFWYTEEESEDENGGN